MADERLRAALEGFLRWLPDVPESCTDDARLGVEWCERQLRTILAANPPDAAPACRCDGAAYHTTEQNAARHPFLMHPDCPVHQWHGPTATPPDAAPIGRHGCGLIECPHLTEGERRQRLAAMAEHYTGEPGTASAQRDPEGENDE